MNNWVKYASVLILLTLTLLMVSGCGLFGDALSVFQARETWEGLYSLEPGTEIAIVNENGSVHVRQSATATELSLTVIKRSFQRANLEDVEIVVTPGTTFRAETIYPDPPRRSVVVEWDVVVPEGLILSEVKTSNGHLVVVGTSGDLKAETSNGNLRLQGIDGYVHAWTSNGRAQVQDCRGIDRVRSSNGGIEVDVRAIRDRVEISTSNGRVVAALSPELDAALTARTSNGRVSVDEELLQVQQHSQTEFVGTMGAGDYEVFLRTSNGNIRIEALR